jgi:hypothetical protein
MLGKKIGKFLEIDAQVIGSKNLPVFSNIRECFF